MHLSATNSERKYETFLSAQRMNCLFFIEGHTPCRMDETVLPTKDFGMKYGDLASLYSVKAV